MLAIPTVAPVARGKCPAGNGPNQLAGDFHFRPRPLLGAAHCPRYRRRADDSSLFLTTLPSPPLPEAQRHHADRFANAPRRRRQDPSGGEDRTSELLPMPGCTIFGIFMPRPCYWLGSLYARSDGADLPRWLSREQP